VVVGNGTDDIKVLASLGTTTTVLHGNAAGLPTFGAVALASDVSGDLPFANLAQGAALSVLGVTGNATADVASIAAASDHQVMRRSGTAVAFGAVNLAQSAAVTGVLPVANGGTGSAAGAGALVAATTIVDADIKTLPTTIVTLVAAPGAGFRIKPLSCTWTLDTSAGAYTNISATISNLVVQTHTTNFWLSTPLTSDSAYGLTQLADFLGAAHTKVLDILFPFTYAQNLVATQLDGYVAYAGIAGVPTVSDVENRALALGMTNAALGNLTGGNAANTLKVTLTYRIEAL
jgi:hypothetical protein